MMLLQPILLSLGVSVLNSRISASTQGLQNVVKRKKDDERRRQLFETSLYKHFIDVKGNASYDEVDDFEMKNDESFESTCVYYNPYDEVNEFGERVMSYWSYEVCLNKKIQQFHLRPRASADKQTEYDIITNNHLGSFLDPAKISRMKFLQLIDKDWGREEVTSLAMENNIQDGYYGGGSECGNVRRSAKIIMDNSCCDVQSKSRPESNDSRFSSTKNDEELMQSIFPSQSDMLRIVGVQEKAVCKYQFSVCRKCSKQSKQSIAGTTENEQQIIKTFMHSSPSNSGHQLSSDPSAFPPFPPSKVESNLERISIMFRHAFDNYLSKAYPASELRPLSCKPGTFDLVRISGLTLIDSLSTLILMGNHTEFARSVERLRLLDSDGGLFAIDANVSLFETNIRVLGALISSHQLAISTAWIDEEITMSDGSDDTCSSYWEYDGILLSLAHDLGKRLLWAFQTKTGIPFGTVNLLYGVPKGETTVASLAGGGTLTIEMELLSRLTGDESFGKAAKLATRAFWIRRSKLGLLGKHIDVQTGIWKETLSGVGSNSDSFYEYLLKHYLLFPEDEDFWVMFQNAYTGIFLHSRIGDWYADVDMNNGLKSARPNFESLMAFFPGIQILLGETTFASRTISSICNIREELAFLPERFDFSSWIVQDPYHPLRPEIHESIHFLHKVSKDIPSQMMKDWNITDDTPMSSVWHYPLDFAISAIESMAQTECGFAAVQNVSPETTGLFNQGSEAIILLHDEMPSFFLSETLKYFYLAMNSSNILDSDQSRDWIFSTEAQPLHHQSTQGGFQDLKRDIIRSLKDRITGIKSRTTETNFTTSIVLSSFDKNRFQSEKWSSSSSMDTYLNQINDQRVQRESFTKFNQDFTSIFGKVMERHLIRRLNVALFKDDNYSNHNQLTKTCPNEWDPSSLWLHALDCSQLDYDDRFTTKIMDTESTDNLHVRSAILSSALFGAQVNDGGCLQSLPSVEKDKKTQDGTKFFFEGLGYFDITSFSEGSGFYIKKLSSGGESIRATIFEDRTVKEDLSGLVSVEYEKPLHESENPITQSFKSLKDFFSSREFTTSPTAEAKTAVVLADLDGHSFFCEVEILRPVSLSDTFDTDSISQYESLGKFPCLAAQYGPTQMNNLVKTNGVKVQAPLFNLKQTDEFGCDDQSLSDTYDIEEEKRTESRIQLVQRGVCTFRQKAKANSKLADAVIVLNNEENQLFVMTDSSTEPTDFDCDGTCREPISVLISKRNGETIMNVLNDNRGQLEATVSLISQDVNSKDISKKGNLQWPIVFTSSSQVQIFASQGWGIMVERNRSGGGEKWKVMMLQHEIKSSVQ